MSDLHEILAAAVTRGDLLESTADNIADLLDSSENPVYLASVEQLLASANWEELNDRFFKKLAFGTGGMRARTIGRTVTQAERGTPGPLDRPEHPAVGSNCMNYHNLSRATQGLVGYLKSWFVKEGREGRPSIAIAHDTRHFSADFARFCAKVAAENGCDVFLFDGPRSTPQLSFAVRSQNATGGIVLTASHNPSHDNGYKVYFEDGAQVVQPHANAIIDGFNSTPNEAYEPLPADQQGVITTLGAEFDEVYMKQLEALLLQPDLVASAGDLKIVFTNLHGVGGVISPQMLRRLGFQCDTVPEQDTQDGRFPTVASPNPENGPALQMAIDQANRDGADIVIGTDPDCDRMGVAVRNREGAQQLLTGNQIGSLMGWYRIKTFFDQGVLNEGNRDRAIWIKTLVTSPLQDAIATGFGIQIVNTLTGFKYIGEKLRKYEEAIPPGLRANYRRLSTEQTRALRLEHSKFFVFGGEESYGYLADDALRDKDGNGAVVMFAEVAAYAKSEGITLVELMDRVYEEFGYFLELGKSISMEGADGAAKIARLAESYRANPPAEVDGVTVARVRNFFDGGQIDEEGDGIPAEKMLICELADGRSFAVRPSGTEPKIKYYLMGNAKPEAGKLADAKAAVAAALDSLWTWLQADIDNRLAG